MQALKKKKKHKKRIMLNHGLMTKITRFKILLNTCTINVITYMAHYYVTLTIRMFTFLEEFPTFNFNMNCFI